MPAPITNGEAGSSVRTKLNTGFTELATAQTDIDAAETAIAGKQDTLVSGTNIKTINSTSILGSGDIAISGSVSDGDKGDITVSGSGATWTIDAASVTLAKMANLAQDQFIGRTTASTGVPQTATITTAARTVLDDTTVAAMVNTLGGATSTGTGGLARATSPVFVTPALGTPSSGVLTNCTGLPTAGHVDDSVTNAKLANMATATFKGRVTAGTGDPEDLSVAQVKTALNYTAADVGALSEAIAADVTAGTEIAEDDGILWTDTSDSDIPKTGAVSILRTRLANIPVGTGLGTSGSVAVNFATLAGTRQSITLTGNLTLTTSNLAAGRWVELRIAAGGSTRTITYPAWIAFGAALPTSLASGEVLIISLFANSTTDASVDAVAVVSA